MPKKSIYLTYATILLFPVVACAIFAYFPIGSIGPLVPIYGLVSGVILSYSFAYQFSNRIFKFGAIALGIVLGLFVAVLLMNLFIFLTQLFGIMDYQLM